MKEFFLRISNHKRIGVLACGVFYGMAAKEDGGNFTLLHSIS